MRTKSADLKNKFLFKSFVAFHAPLMLGKATYCHVLLRVIGEIKVSRDQLRCVFVRFVTAIHQSKKLIPILVESFRNLH